MHFNRTDGIVPFIGLDAAHLSVAITGILPIWISVAWFSVILYSYPFCVYRKYKPAATLTLAIGLSLQAIVNGYADPTVVKIEIPLSGLPSVFDGFEICMLKKNFPKKIFG